MRRLASGPIFFGAFVVLILSLWPAAASARKPCGSSDAQKQAAGLLPALGSLGRAFSSDSCQSIAAVFDELTRGKVRGGRQLQGESAPDLAAAESERQAAHRDPEFANTLKAETAGESDPARLQLIEAALLHDFRHYKARDLLLRRLLAAQGG